MRRIVLASALLAMFTGCSKADSPNQTGSTQPVKEVVPNPSGAGVVGGPRGVAGAGEGAIPTDESGPDDSYTLQTAEVSGVAGGEQVARVVVTPSKGFHINKDYPTKLTLQLPEGVTSPKLVLEPGDAERFTDTQLTFAVKLTAVGKGDYAIPATLKFAVCTDSTCNPKKQSIALAIKAQ